MYSVQRNHHCDVIVVKGTTPEQGYWIMFRGSFSDCNQIAKTN